MALLATITPTPHPPGGETETAPRPQRDAAAPALDATPPPRRVFSLLVALAFASVLGFFLFRHVMWFDEWQAWLIARDARSLRELFVNLRYETHPALWYLILWVASRFTRDYHVVQAIHLLFATSGVWLAVRYLGMSRLQCLLYAASYYVAYEDCIISRSYVLTFFFTVVAAAAFQRRKTLLFYVALILMCQVEAFALVVAFALLCAEWTRALLDWRAARRGVTTSPDAGPVRDVRWRVIGSGVLAISALVSFLQVRPPPDCSFRVGTTPVPESMWLLPGRAWFPYSHDLNWFWGDDLLLDTRYPGREIELAIGGAIALATCLALWRSKPAFIFFVTGVLCATGALHAIGITTQRRHLQTETIMLISAFWLAGGMTTASRRHAAKAKRDDTSPQTSVWRVDVAAQLMKVLGCVNEHRGTVLAILLLVQVPPTIQALRTESRLPFSQSKAIAQTIRDGYPASTPVVVVADLEPALAGYLDRPVYIVRQHSYGTFVVWNQKLYDDPWDRRNSTPHPWIATCQRLLQETHRDRLLVVASASFEQVAEAQPHPAPSIRRVRAFDAILANHETSCVLYEVSLSSAAPVRHNGPSTSPASLIPS